MRILVDTNLFIAWLLKPRDDSLVSLLLEAVVSGKLTLLMPAELLQEVAQTFRRKPYLSQVITDEQVEQFVRLIQALSEEIPRITGPIPPITRDPKDDYLIAYALVGQADCLISGDRDLLELMIPLPFAILDSHRFRQVLHSLT